MDRKSFRLMFCVFFSISILAACASPTVVVTPPPLTDTQVLPQNTQSPLTVTPVPPTPTLEPSPTESLLIIEPGRIEGMVDVGGRSLYIKCEGEGSPTIILESSWYLTSGFWNKDNVFSNLAGITRTCQYDRANVGKSDPAPTPRTTQDMVNDLHALLVNAQISGPYVLVGSDIGGWINRLFAGQYLEEVAGMVLLDSFHPDQNLNISAAFPTATPNESAELTAERNFWESFYQDGIAEDSEGWNLETSAEQVRAVTSLGDIPLRVLSADKGYWRTFEHFSNMSLYIDSPEKNKILDETWLDMQQELASLSSEGIQKTLGSGIKHVLPADIVSQVGSVVKEVQANMP